MLCYDEEQPPTEQVLSRGGKFGSLEDVLGGRFTCCWRKGEVGVSAGGEMDGKPVSVGYSNKRKLTLHPGLGPPT